MAVHRHSPTRELAEYAGVRLALGLVRPWPWSWAMPIGRTLAPLLYRVNRRHREVGRRNLRIAYGDTLAPAESERILRAMYAHIVATVVEVGRLADMPRDRVLEVVQFAEPDRFEDLKQRLPVVALTGHVGNFDLLALGISAHGVPISFFARPMDNDRLYRYLNRTRGRFGNRVLDNKGTVRDAYRLLKRGGVLGMLGDHNAVRADGGEFVEFFGVPASTHTSGSKLAIRAGARLVPAFIQRNPDGKHLIHIADAIEPDDLGDGTIDERALEMTRRGAAATEAFIRRYPDQWLWGHRRWKTRPPGEPKLY